MRLSGRPLLLQLAWHVLAILVFLCLPVLHWRVPWWELPRGEVRAIAVLLVGYAATALAVMIFARPGTPRAFSRGLALALSIFGLFLLGMLLTRLDAPRYLLLPVFLAVVVLAPIAVAPRMGQIVGVGVLAVVLLAVAGLDARVVFAQQKVKLRRSSRRNVKTAFYVLRVRSHEGAVAVPATRGGGLDRLDDRILLGTGDGHLYTCVSRVTTCRFTRSRSACRRIAKSSPRPSKAVRSRRASRATTSSTRRKCRPGASASPT